MSKAIKKAKKKEVMTPEQVMVLQIQKLEETTRGLQNQFNTMKQLVAKVDKSLSIKINQLNRQLTGLEGDIFDANALMTGEIGKHNQDLERVNATIQQHSKQFVEFQAEEMPPTNNEE